MTGADTLTRLHVPCDRGTWPDVVTGGVTGDVTEGVTGDVAMDAAERDMTGA